ncbi:MAG: hypothetical protein FWH04_09660 [Oscillospiraceae bacterium]|nr:hypothetical protein [Oscillospiraceae bacterium]
MGILYEIVCFAEQLIRRYYEMDNMAFCGERTRPTPGGQGGLAYGRQ